MIQNDNDLNVAYPPEIRDHYDPPDLFSGLRLIGHSLLDLADRASFAVGLGSGGLGGVLLGFGLERTTAIGLIALGVFFVGAKAGRLLDGAVDRRVVPRRLPGRRRVLKLPSASNIVETREDSTGA